ncbi:hypothetical protein [Stackebrandtia soli]|uniref:hypothetical protein n=1 Tax=Stackebrandtia soli TaxID=1892856 RepID=UPI0039ECA082
MKNAIKTFRAVISGSSRSSLDIIRDCKRRQRRECYDDGVPGTSQDLMMIYAGARR